MKEAALTEVKSLIKDRESFALFLYTPLCGTCKLGARMLDIVLHMDATLAVYQANINEMPALAQEWQISSVPCLLVIKDGEVVERTYAMRSVDYLYELLLKLKA